jgi:predicted polyphosphate/ATP-dependent NAD kinase
VPTFAYVPDSHGIAESALSEFGSEVCCHAVESPRTAARSRFGARALAAAHCVAVLTLGGDGTNRAFALGWRRSAAADFDQQRSRASSKRLPAPRLD